MQNILSRKSGFVIVVFSTYQTETSFSAEFRDASSTKSPSCLHVFEQMKLLNRFCNNAARSTIESERVTRCASRERKKNRRSACELDSKKKEKREKEEKLTFAHCSVNNGRIGSLEYAGGRKSCSVRRIRRSYRQRSHVLSIFLLYTVYIV